MKYLYIIICLTVICSIPKTVDHLNEANKKQLMKKCEEQLLTEECAFALGE